MACYRSNLLQTNVLNMKIWAVGDKPAPRPRQPGKRPKSTIRHPNPGSPSPHGCCPMVAAVRSVRQGKYRLARRYAAMSVRLLAARVV